MKESSKPLPSHWEILKTQDAELNEKIQVWRSHINGSDALERKYKELMMVAMSCVIRFTDGIRIHGQFALDFGATEKELLAAIEQSFFVGGIPAFREGMYVYYELFGEKIDTLMKK